MHEQRAAMREGDRSGRKHSNIVTRFKKDKTAATL